MPPPPLQPAGRRSPPLGMAFRPATPNARFTHADAPSRGSVLITALIFSAIIAIYLASYIRLALNSLKLADRSFYQNAALNLAEVGIERALYCYNHLDSVTTAASAWTDAGWPSPATDNSEKYTFSDFNLGPGVTGQVKVYCSHYNPGTGVVPVIVSKATVTFASGGGTLSKYMEVTLRKRSLFVNGLVARDSMVWNGGNSSADSWNSDHDNDPTTAAVAYGSTSDPAKANASVGTPSAVDNALSFGGGTIRGRVMDGGGTISKTSGAVLSSTTSGTGWDTSLVSTDFSASFPAVTVPSPPSLSKNLVSSSAPISFPSTLPRSGDVAWNGVYYYEFGSAWKLSSAGSASNIVTINGPVVFLATAHQNVNVIDLAGNASIAIAASTTANLKVYTNGNVEASGNGITNANAAPAAMQIYGTNTTAGGQTIRFVGNGASSSTVYAPNATFELNGNGSLKGSVVANSIKLVGNAAFHYDEALGNMTTGNPFGIAKWRELQSESERNEYSTQLNF
ncbi:MAG: hypothetical protein EXS37_17665 [Opitutus sp.]|nr:hypothetical protein [Opitutus sp.]